MNDKAELLGQLKIDRNVQPESSGAGKWIAIGLVVVAAAVGAWLLFKPAPAIAVTAASAVSASSASAQGASVLDASGYVVARRQAVVSSKVTGKVVELLIEEGRAVEEGEILARLDDINARGQLNLAQSQLDAARAARAEVEVQLVDARRQLRRTTELHGKNLVSDAALDNAQAAVDSLEARLESATQNVRVADRGVSVQRQLLEDTIVRAPFNGVITLKNAQVGEMISPLGAGGAGTRTGIGTLVDMDSLEIEVDVNENFINRVEPGQPVTAMLNAYPDWKIPASVIAVIPTADRSKATVKVRIAIGEKDPRIIPDMGVRVSFLNEKQEEEQAPSGVFIPTAAIHDDGGTPVVYVLRGETAERRAIRVAGTRGADSQVIAGLSAGERVATSALDQLVDGAIIEIVE